MREPEQIARAAIDDLLRAAGWQVCGVADANIHGTSGVHRGIERRFLVSDHLARTTRSPADRSERKNDRRHLQDRAAATALSHLPEDVEDEEEDEEGADVSAREALANG